MFCILIWNRESLLCSVLAVAAIQYCNIYMKILLTFVWVLLRYYLSCVKAAKQAKVRVVSLSVRLRLLRNLKISKTLLSNKSEMIGSSPCIMQIIAIGASYIKVNIYFLMISVSFCEWLGFEIKFKYKLWFLDCPIRSSTNNLFYLATKLITM